MFLEFDLFLVSLSVAIVLLVIVIIYLLVPRKKIWPVVKKMMEEEKTLEQILKYASEKKWNSKEVEIYYLYYAIKDFMEQGYNKDEIASMAEDNGWPIDMIHTVLQKIR